jgi:UDP-N-acetylmuramate dehydrogenase
MKIVENISLRPFNTFNVDAETLKFASVRNERDIMELADKGLLKSDEMFLLGGGSNVLFVGNFNGLVGHSEIAGIKILESDDDSVLLEVGAGELWHNFVTICLKNKYYGLENLALIPGTVGAAPVQNIGAYGAEQQNFFHSLRGFNFETFEFQDLSFDDCRFGYRDSVFKNALKDKFIVTSVRYKLLKKYLPNLSYKELENEAKKFNISNPDAHFIYDTVCRLRLSKLPDFDTLGNAGSFFKNPIVGRDTLEKIKSKINGLKAYPVNEKEYKISAALLVEKAGWKGKRIGDAGVYDKHALVLVNYGNATGSDIYDLALKIQESVFDEFEVHLEPEVIIVKSNE